MDVRAESSGCRGGYQAVRRRRVLSDVSFQVDEGEDVCVLGRPGRASRRLLRCINWLGKPGRRANLSQRKSGSASPRTAGE